MTVALQQLRLVALNIDGVLLNDTFSPVIHHFVVSRGGTYSADLERRIFSQPRDVAGREMAAAVVPDLTGEEALSAYFADRDDYLRGNPVARADGAVDLLHRVRLLGLGVVCYGGLDKEHFDRYLGDVADLFDGPGYVCTNDFRPGIREIAEIFGLEPDRTLFVDDVARVAEAARDLGASFIGVPTSFPHSHQRELMREAGVRHLVDRLGAIDETLLRAVDAEAALDPARQR
ncbi:HAD family hydrolase [Streptacidiphilus sp. MAP12-33]|uniref:HAD family hydrolase n=1 Tax=Streptacidiphilus sp. MAP12-33 TaxID=3156266 RepID=UPI003513487F